MTCQSSKKMSIRSLLNLYFENLRPNSCNSLVSHFVYRQKGLSALTIASGKRTHDHGWSLEELMGLLDCQPAGD